MQVLTEFPRGVVAVSVFEQVGDGFTLLVRMGLCCSSSRASRAGVSGNECKVDCVNDASRRSERVTLGCPPKDVRVRQRSRQTESEGIALLDLDRLVDRRIACP